MGRCNGFLPFLKGGHSLLAWKQGSGTRASCPGQLSKTCFRTAVGRERAGPPAHKVEAKRSQRGVGDMSWRRALVAVAILAAAACCEAQQVVSVRSGQELADAVTRWGASGGDSTLRIAEYLDLREASFRCAFSAAANDRWAGPGRGGEAKGSAASSSALARWQAHCARQPAWRQPQASARCQRRVRHVGGRQQQSPRGSAALGITLPRVPVA